MKICACGGNLKLIIDDYTIHTRIPIKDLREIKVQNIRFLKCDICDSEMELTEDSEKMVELIRDFYTNLYFEKEKASISSQRLPENTDNQSNFVKDIFKLFRN